MNYGDDTDRFSWREWRPPLSEELETTRVGDEGGGVANGMFSIEFVGGERSEGIVFVGVGDWMQTHFFIFFFPQNHEKGKEKDVWGLVNR